MELYFYHYAVSREIPQGMAAAVAGEKAATTDIPFPYYLKYHPNPEERGK